MVQDLNIPLILQPQLFGILCLVSWAQVSPRPQMTLTSDQVLLWLADALDQYQYYGRKRSKNMSIALFVAAIVLFAAFEVGMIFAIKVRILLLSVWILTYYMSW